MQVFEVHHKNSQISYPKQIKEKSNKKQKV